MNWYADEAEVTVLLPFKDIPLLQYVLHLYICWVGKTFGKSYLGSNENLITKNNQTLTCCLFSLIIPTWSTRNYQPWGETTKEKKKKNGCFRGAVKLSLSKRIQPCFCYSRFLLCERCLSAQFHDIWITEACMFYCSGAAQEQTAALCASVYGFAITLTALSCRGCIQSVKHVWIVWCVKEKASQASP